MGGGTSGGGTTTSTPLTAAQRSELYQAGLSNIGGTSMFSSPAYQYQSPDYVSSDIYDPGAGQSAVYDPGSARQMANGDYDRLEQSIIQSRTAPLLSAYNTQSTKLDSDLARRGIYSSGAAVQAQNDLTGTYLPQLTQAGADAATQRYSMQQSDLQNLNNYNLQRSGQLSSGTQADNNYALQRANQLNTASANNATAANTFNMENANRAYNSVWQPAQYAAGLWNGTSGAISSGSSGGGWNFMI